MDRRPKAVIFDIDEVVCKSWEPKYKQQFAEGHFAEFDFKIPSFPKVQWASTLINSLLLSGIKILFVTSREESRRPATKAWLENELTIFSHEYELFMRSENDTRPSDEVKFRLMQQFRPRFNILFAIDDELHNARMWNRVGIPSLHLLNEYNTKGGVK